MEATLELPDKSKDLAIMERLSSEDNVYAAKDSGNIAISPKSIRTVFPCSSTPKLLGSMSGCMNIRRSPIRLTDSTGLPKDECNVRAWPRVYVADARETISIDAVSL